MKKIVTSTVAFLIALCIPGIAMAHVIVTPNKAGIGQELVFNVSVPNEQQTPVTSVKLLIPSGVTNVTPTMQYGWTIVTTNNNDPHDPEIATITWSGNIPVGRRDDFSFGAQVPGTATDLDWKAYQTYADGTVVHWDQTPSGSDDAVGTAGPYSVTHVINDLSASTTPANNNLSIMTLFVGATALLLALYAAFSRTHRSTN